jgi:PAS domain S-box-containing protein
MQDMRKTKAQLVEELQQLRSKVAQLESAERDNGSEEQSTLEALRESERKFRSLAETTTAHITIIQDERYVYANQAFLDHYELDADDLTLISPEDLMLGSMTPEAIAAAMPAWQAFQESGDTRFRFESEDAEGRWFQTNVTMMELDGKEALMSMDFDITELKRAQREMLRADKMAALGQIVAGVAHEINNPNNFIFFNLPILRRYVEAIAPLLEARLAEEPELTILNMPYEVFLKDVFKLLENMEHGSARITSIVSDLKGYVRNDEGQERKPEQVGQAVGRAMALIGKQVRKMVKRLDVELAEGLPPVLMNAGQIEQVLINLLINAGHAADKEASWVKVSARVAAGAQGGVELRVEDNGAGIPEANLERIFEPFYTSKGREQGTGLGLSISHRIVEEHGGTIDVQSTVGEGSCFTVWLPAVKDA